MAWQPLFLTVVALQLMVRILHFFGSWDDEVFSQWVTGIYQGLRDYLAINYYMDDDCLDTCELWIVLIIFAIVVYYFWCLWEKFDHDHIVRRLLQMFANLPASLVSGFLGCRSSSCNGIEGVLHWVSNSLATFPSSSLLPSEIVLVPGNFPDDNSEGIVVVEGEVVEVNKGLEKVAVVDVALQVAVELPKLAIVALVSTVEIAAAKSRFKPVLRPSRRATLSVADSSA